MRYLILSDIHANWEALAAVVQDARGEYDSVVCLGDFVGYGADPDRVVEWARTNVSVAIRGNHDRACVSLEGLDEFNALAVQSSLWTHRTLKPENLAYLAKLPQGPFAQQDFGIAHGSPANEDDYLITAYEAAEAFPYTTRDVTFFGHTHLQGGFSARRGAVHEMKLALEREVVDVENNSTYLINPGSVGQPRDRRPGAAYALFSPPEHAVTFARVGYDVQETQRKIRAAGLPHLLADRLALGK